MIETKDILKFINGTLSDKEKAKVQLWIDSSESNREEYMFYKSMLDTSEELNDIQLVDENQGWDELENMIENSEKESRVVSFQSRLLRITAVAALFVLLFYAYNWIFIKEPLYKEITSTHVQDTIILVDGTKVYLDTASKLKYYTRVENDFEMREVELTGSAVFEVEHNKDLPFVVKIGDTGVKDLGTIFKTEIDGKKVAVENIQGLIKFFEWENEDNSMILKEGEKAVYDGGKMSRVEEPKPKPKGEMHRVEDVIEYLFHKYEIQTNTAPYADIKMNDSVFVDLNQPLDSIIHQLESTANIKYRKTCKNCYEIGVLKAK
ncbi:MAG TPA: hypothetical protein ENK91_00110 [Bacteroidetes bacterium]|nr:hypothetical protein [Bacteroidota bacterium]